MGPYFGVNYQSVNKNTVKVLSFNENKLEIKMKIQGTQWNNGSWAAPLNTDLNSDRTVITIFGHRECNKNKQLFEELFEKFPDSIFMGCSTSGEIFGTEVNDNTISVAIAKFEKTHFRKVCKIIPNSENSYEIGNHLASALVDDDLKAIFVLSDGLNINGTKLIEGVNDVVSPKTITSGGLAGDGTNFEKTWVLGEDFPEPNIVSMLGIYGEDVEILTGSVGGWDVFGPERKVTKSSGNILYELDHKPALSLYKEYLGPKAGELPGSALLFPLTLKSQYMQREGVVRTILSVDEASNSLTFAGDIPEGSMAQLMKANFDRLVDGASQAASLSKFSEELEENPILSIAISCVGRRLVLGERIEDETEAVLEVLPKNTIQIGFYSYGEISSGKLGTCDLHNQTMTLTTIREN